LLKLVYLSLKTYVLLWRVKLKTGMTIY